MVHPSHFLSSFWTPCIMCAFGKRVCVSQMHVLRFQLLFFFFFFWHAFLTNFFTVQSLLRLLFMNSNHNIWLSSMYGVHCLRNHKLHFLVTFSLKMGPMILFTHLKIILLQCFSVFSFGFQFSAVSKQICLISFPSSYSRKAVV